MSARKKRCAVVGVGNMGRVRTDAFIETGRVEVCGVAARHADRARQFAQTHGCENYSDDFRNLKKFDPDFYLIETPHHAQEAIVRWVIGTGTPVLIGGCPASTVEEARWILAAAEQKKVVVEAGYEARYKQCWERTKAILASNVLGEVVAVRAVALYPASPQTWYYDEQLSGGMPLTHMTYAFINSLRWLLGNPSQVSALANQKKVRTAQAVREETCCANLLFPRDVLCTLTAGYVCPDPDNEEHNWELVFHCTKGELILKPSDAGPGGLEVRQGTSRTRHEFAGDRPFVTQANAFLDALDFGVPGRNPPREFLGDIVTARAIVDSCRSLTTIMIPAESLPDPAKPLQKKARP